MACSKEAPAGSSNKLICATFVDDTINKCGTGGECAISAGFKKCVPPKFKPGSAALGILCVCVMPLLSAHALTSLSSPSPAFPPTLTPLSAFHHHRKCCQKNETHRTHKTRNTQWCRSHTPVLFLRYCIFCASCLFGPYSVQKMTPKWSISIAFVSFTLYSVCNVVVAIYPSVVSTHGEYRRRRARQKSARSTCRRVPAAACFVRRASNQSADGGKVLRRVGSIRRRGHPPPGRLSPCSSSSFSFFLRLLRL